MSELPEVPAARITVIDGDGCVVVQRVATLPVTFGRNPEQADVEMQDRMVSRVHARLEVDMTIIDLDSGNGTWVGGEQVERRVLLPDDVLTLGSSTVVCSRVAREPELGRAWCIVVGAEGLRALPLTEFHAAWVQAAEQVEALGPVGHADAVAEVGALLDGPLAEIGAWTLAVCGQNPSVFAASVARFQVLAAHRRAGAVVGGPEVDAEDRRFLARLAAALHRGAAVFAEHGAATPTDGSDELQAALRTILAVVTEWDQRLAHQVVEAPPRGGASRSGLSG